MVFEPQKTDKREAPESHQDDGAGLRMGNRGSYKDHRRAMAVTALVYMLVWFNKWMFNVDFRFLEGGGKSSSTMKS